MQYLGAKQSETLNLHKTIARLVASGASTIEIAELCNYPIGKLEVLFNIPEFIQLVEAHQTGSGSDVGENLIKGQLVPSVLKMVKIRDDPKTAPRLQYEIAKYFLDRNFGPLNSTIGKKAPNSLENGPKVSDPYELGKLLEEKIAKGKASSPRGETEQTLDSDDFRPTPFPSATTPDPVRFPGLIQHPPGTLVENRYGEMVPVGGSYAGLPVPPNFRVTKPAEAFPERYKTG